MIPLSGEQQGSLLSLCVSSSMSLQMDSLCIWNFIQKNWISFFSWFSCQILLESNFLICGLNSFQPLAFLQLLKLFNSLSECSVKCYFHGLYTHAYSKKMPLQIWSSFLASVAQNLGIFYFSSQSHFFVYFSLNVVPNILCSAKFHLILNDQWCRNGVRFQN